MPLEILIEGAAGFNTITEALKTLGKAKGMFGKGGGAGEFSSNEQELRGIIGDLDASLIEIRTEYLATLARMSELEKALAEAHAKKAQAERYTLREPWSNRLYVYEINDGSEPHHYACVHCLDQGHRSILQAGQPGQGDLFCPNCKLGYSIHKPPAGDLRTGFDIV
jgi:hypothetical protein